MGLVQGKIAIVTGAASGIGRATAGLMVREGAIATLTDVNEAAGAAVAAELGAPTRFIRQDVSDEASWQGLVADVLGRHGRLDILVNCAGVSGVQFPQNPETTSLEDWRKVNAVNLEGVFLGCKHALPAMRQGGGGAIVNISSLAAMVGTPGPHAYGAGKAGVRQLTKSVALWGAREHTRVRCNSVHPGIIETPMGEEVFGLGGDAARGREAFKKSVPMRRLGEPIDIAYAVLYLASDEAKFVTGAELVVDGGMYAA
jgi:NAD(P)-dependent dehydrogenase (short-subunit alcohol dehydrogenase family)